MGIPLWKTILFFAVILAAGIFLLPSRRQMGFFYSRANNFSAAMPYLEEQYRKNPDDFFNTLRFLQALADEGKFKRFEEVARILEMDYPRQPMLLDTMADYFEGQLLFDRASFYWERLLTLDPTLDEIQGKMLAYYQAQKKTEQLIRFYVQEAPAQKNPDMFYALAEIYSS